MFIIKLVQKYWFWKFFCIFWFNSWLLRFDSSLLKSLRSSILCLSSFSWKVLISFFYWEIFFRYFLMVYLLVWVLDLSLIKDNFLILFSLCYFFSSEISFSLSFASDTFSNSVRMFLVDFLIFFFGGKLPFCILVF